MNFRLTMVLAMVLVVAGIVLTFLRPWEEKAPVAADGKKTVFTPALGDVTGLTLESEGEKRVAFAKEGEGWKMTYPVEAKAEKFAVDDVARGLKELAYKEKFEPASEGFKSASGTGTDKPQNVVTFTDGAGKSHVLKLGKSTVDAIYATVDDGKTIYLLETNPLTQLDKGVDEFRDKSVLNVNAEQVQGLTIKREGQTVVLAKRDGKWLVEAPIAARANGTAVQEILNELRGVRATGFTDVVKKESVGSGLTPPVLTVTAMVADAPVTPPTTSSATQPAGKAVTLELGYYVEPMAKKNVYASASGVKGLFQFDAKSFDKLNKQLNDLRDPAVVPGAVGQATEAKVEVAGKPAIVMVKKEGGWTVSGGEAGTGVAGDGEAIRGVLEAVAGLRAIKFVDAAGNLAAIGLDPPMQRIELTVPGQSQHEVLLVGKPETAEKVTPVMRQGEPTVYLVQSVDAEKLTVGGSVLGLREKAIERLDADRIKSIEISGSVTGGGNATLTRAGAGWTLAGGAKVDESKISALLSELTPVTAVKWVMAGQTSQGATVQVKVTMSEGPATTMPTTMAAGPALEKVVERRLLLYRNEKDGKTEWTAVWEGQEGAQAWTFEPAAGLVEKVTKVGYGVAETQPATQPATLPAEGK